MSKKQKKVLFRIIISTIMLIILNIVPVTGILRAALFLLCYLVISYDVLIKAIKGILNGQVLDENFLMTIATIGAISIAIYDKTGDYNEAIFVILLYQIGELFQSYAIGKSRKSIGALMDIRPDYANIESEGKLIKVSPEEITINSHIIVQPGEKIPLDGFIVKGSSTLNTSALTGESLPREVSVGNEVISGCINIDGVLEIQTTKEFGESTVSKILNLVENASSRKSKSEQYISKFSRIYTPAVCIGALLLAVLPPLFRLILSMDPNFSDWIYRALTFLVISCPCALVISIPLSFFAGIGGASKAGILIKGSNYLEALSKTKYVVFDKTGTLTAGVFEVTGVHHSAMEESKLLEYAVLAECASSHPISKSLKKAYGKRINRKRVTDIQEISGHGIIANIDGNHIAVGNSKLMEKIGVEYLPCHKTGTIIHIAINENYSGHIVISDIIKKDSVHAIALLKTMGIKKTIMLTGDSEAVAKDVANKLDLDAYYSELLPEDKVIRIEEIIESKNAKDNLAFVGDGINDAPVLSRADIGIAMGAMGSDAAIEAADVVLMDDNPLKISTAIKVSKKCLRIVHQNLFFALGIKAICLILGAVGIADMWLAIFADVGVTIIAVLNAIRALNTRKLQNV